jgi:hypothetical protein
LEGDDLDYCMITEDDGGSSGVALAWGPTLKRLGELIRPMFLIGLDPILRDRWLSRLANASWLEVSLSPKTGSTTDALLFSGDGEGHACLVLAVMVVWSSTTDHILIVLFCLYLCQLYIIMFMNINNICL